MASSQPRQRLYHIIEAARPSLIITGAQDSFSFGGRHVALPALLSSVAGIDAHNIAAHEIEVEGTINASETQEPLPYCYLLFTSGSTGKPVAVCGTERSIINRIQWMQARYPMNQVNHDSE